MNVLEINVLVLAYLGDSVYETYVREYLINRGLANVNDLQKKSLDYVSAKGQAKILQMLINEDFFVDEELSIMKRARNYKSKSHPKNCDILTYKHATSFEALIGYHRILKNNNRIDKIMHKVFQIVESGE